MEAKAQEAGYESMDAAIEATRHMPSRTAAARLGIGASTVKRRRGQRP